MWSFYVFVSLLTWAGAQYRSARQHQGPGYLEDIRLAVPGDPGNDYPTLGSIPRTSFSCSGKAPGYYADLETNCQAFRVCTTGSTYGFQSFLCPNGTLFNQAVFVCDWWMNVNCQKSAEFINNNNDKFGNLKLGPQLMKDIKKMITHPMRNPYDKSTMKSNLIVMQDYRPPPNPMFGALLQGAARSPNSIYTPAKQVEAPYNQNSYSNGNIFAASTPSPSYVPPSFNTESPAQRDAEVFQRQRQSGQYQQSGRLQNAPTPRPSYVPPSFNTESPAQRDAEVFQRQRQSGQYQQSGRLQNAPTPAPSYVPPSFNTESPAQRDAEVFQRQRQGGQYQQSGRLQNAPSLGPSYVSPSFNTESPAQRDAEVFQRQRQSDQYQQSGRLQNAPKTQVSNSHTSQFSQLQNLGFPFSTVNSLQKPAQLYNTPAQFKHQQNIGNTQTVFNQQTGQYRQNGQYTDGRNEAQVNAKQSGFDITYRKQQYTAPSSTLNDNSGHINTEAKQNLVSNEQPATIVTKTLTFNRIVDPEPGKPKSRITIKTWIIKPTKAAKLIAEPSSYNYPRPTNPAPAKQVAETPYVYNPPTTAQSARIITEGYSYNRPTTAVRQVEGYNYERPTVAAKIVTTVREAPRLYLPPTSPPPTLSRLYLNPNSAPPTAPSRLYIAPTTYKPAAKLYLPPSQPNVILSRQYLPPSALQQPANYQNEKLQASPTTPTPVYATPPDNPSFSLTKHSHTKTNHNNLTFADILTKEKLDITVNDIVSDTSKVLQTASPQTEQFGQYRQDKDYSEETYVTSGISEESDERLTPQSPTVVATSARLIAGPARELEPPVETHGAQNIVNNNRLANLPFYKEPETSTNTIERTVSLKISIPEKVASYLFKSRNETEYDKLEILNTGSSNYLVLTNNILTNKNPGANFIPIGRLIADKTTNISDSQALVFNFLADSLNQAKEYSNIAKQNIAASTPAQFTGVNNQELSRITNQISELTASQYTNQNNNNHGNIVTHTTSNQYQTAKYTNGYPQNQQQINPAPARLTSQQGYSYQNNGPSGNLKFDQNQIFSGQLYKLPVTEVTNHIYNAGPANLVQAQYLAPNTNQNGNGNNFPKQSNAEVEIVQSQTLPIAPAPAKLQQLTPSNEAETFNGHEHSGALFSNFLNNGNGISAQLQDKIVGTIPHPLEDNKLVTYKKDQTYYVYTKSSNNVNANNQLNNVQQNVQSAKIVQGQPNIVFQFIPSVGYQLEDEKEQQKILNAFQIDEFGSPKKVSQTQDNQRRGDLISEINYSIDHPQFAKQIDGQINEVNTLYAGPSSYSAPQASVGSLEAHEGVPNARLELEDNNKFNGY